MAVINQKNNMVDIINDIACELAKKEIGFTEQDKEDQLKLKLLSSKINENRTEVDKTINIIYKSMISQFPGIDFPKEIKMDIAENISQQIEVSGLKSTSQISKGQVVIEEVLNKVLKNSNKTIDDLRNESKNNLATNNLIQPQLSNWLEDKSAELPKEAIFENNILKLYDGKEIAFEEPLDEKYKFVNEDAKQEEAIIEVAKNNIENLTKYYEQNPEKMDLYLEKFSQVIKETNNGLGLDAALRWLDDQTEIDQVNIVLSSPLKQQSIKLLLDQLKVENANDLGFNDDNYTVLRKLNIFSKIIADKTVQINNPEILEMLRDVDLEIYELIERNPDIIQQLQLDYGKRDMQDIAIEFSGTSESIGREEFLKDLEEFSKTHQSIKIDKSEDADKNANTYRKNEISYDKSIETLKPNISQEEKIENLKTSMRNMSLVNGIKGIQDFATNNIVKNTNGKDNIFTEAILSVLEEKRNEIDLEDSNQINSRKDLFMAIINRDVKEKNILQRMVGLDKTASEMVLNELINKQNSGNTNPQMIHTIMELGKHIGKENNKKSKIFSTDKIPTGGVSLFHKDADDDAR